MMHATLAYAFSKNALREHGKRVLPQRTEQQSGKIKQDVRSVTSLGSNVADNKDRTWRMTQHFFSHTS
jgi:hypothetical protein